MVWGKADARRRGGTVTDLSAADATYRAERGPPDRTVRSRPGCVNGHIEPEQSFPRSAGHPERFRPPPALVAGRRGRAVRCHTTWVACAPSLGGRRDGPS